jgi:hypothetical protein
MIGAGGAGITKSTVPFVPSAGLIPPACAGDLFEDGEPEDSIPQKPLSQLGPLCTRSSLIRFTSWSLASALTGRCAVARSALGRPILRVVRSSTLRAHSCTLARSFVQPMPPGLYPTRRDPIKVRACSREFRVFTRRSKPPISVSADRRYQRKSSRIRTYARSTARYVRRPGRGQRVSVLSGCVLSWIFE